MNHRIYFSEKRRSDIRRTDAYTEPTIQNCRNSGIPSRPTLSAKTSTCTRYEYLVDNRVEYEYRELY